MRIGNLEDMEKTEESGSLAELIKAEAESEANLSNSKKAKNWWYYNKWYVVGSIIITGILINLVGSFLGLWEKEPDFQIAYVGKETLPQDTISALEQGFASIAEDYNNDGAVIVKINQYTYNGQNADAALTYYGYEDEIPLIGDISNRDSFFFLTDDPDSLQERMQILAFVDGSRPGDQDYSTEGKVIAWVDCPILTEMELGDYNSSILGEEIIISNQELLSGFYIGRRFFYDDRVSDNYEECCQLWDLIRDSSNNR